MRLTPYLIFLTFATTASAASPQPPVFSTCASCHAVSTPTAHGIGPSLAGVVGRHAGSAEGFMYSPAMREADIQWTPQNLDRFLESPTKVVPGNHMAFQGLPDAAERRAIIEYLTDR